MDKPEPLKGSITVSLALWLFYNIFNQLFSTYMYYIMLQTSMQKFKEVQSCGF